MDPEFHALVTAMLSIINSSNFTSTEIREAALLANIIYHEDHIGEKTLPFELSNWLWSNSSEKLK